MAGAISTAHDGTLKSLMLEIIEKRNFSIAEHHNRRERHKLPRPSRSTE
jgi:hypothetical protein